MNGMDYFNIFMDKVSSIVLDVCVGKGVGFDELFPLHCIRSKSYEEHRLSIEDEMMHRDFLEWEGLYSSFIESLTPKMYHEYMQEQEDAYSLHVEMNMAC